MKRRSLSRLGETEMEVLHLVWAIGEASVGDVHDRILGYRSVAYTTVMTVILTLIWRELQSIRQELSKIRKGLKL